MHKPKHYTPDLDFSALEVNWEEQNYHLISVMQEVNVTFLSPECLMQQKDFVLFMMLK